MHLVAQGSVSSRQGDDRFQCCVGIDLPRGLRRRDGSDIHDRPHPQYARAIDIAGEVDDVGIVRMEQDLLRLALLYDDPVLQDYQMIGEFQRLVEIVTYEDDGLVQLLLQFQEERSCMSVRISGSSAENASSISMIGAFEVSARAIPTRCCMPPES